MNVIACLFTNAHVLAQLPGTGPVQVVWPRLDLVLLTGGTAHALVVSVQRASCNLLAGARLVTSQPGPVWNQPLFLFETSLAVVKRLRYGPRWSQRHSRLCEMIDQSLKEARKAHDQACWQLRSHLRRVS